MEREREREKRKKTKKVFLDNIALSRQSVSKSNWGDFETNFKSRAFKKGMQRR